MARVNQSTSGKAWEYGLAKAAANIFSIPFIINNPSNAARLAYNSIDEEERIRIDNAASEAICFLRANDDFLTDTAGVAMQSDMEGMRGDVRDVIIRTGDGIDVGISAKHRHRAVKHPRLSLNIDFGSKWYGVPCSGQYRQAIQPIWKKLSDAKAESKRWKDLPNKANAIYAPITRVFIAEIARVCKPNVRTPAAEKLLRYMLGKLDFYKIIKDNGNVELQSFNLHGSLGWGRRLPMPRWVINVAEERETTAIITFDKGWALSLRVHNADSQACPSVKFDVNLVGTPSQTNHVIRYR